MHALMHFMSNPGLVSHAGHALRLAGDHAPSALGKVAGPAGKAVGMPVKAFFRLLFI